MRHDARNRLMVIREGISLVSDGAGKKECKKCVEFLKPGLDSLDKLNKLIEDMIKDCASQIMSLGSNKADLQEKELEKLSVLKNQMMHMVSHVIRTPLCIIKEGVSLVLDEIPGKLNPEQKKFLSYAKTNADRLVDSIERILHTPLVEIAESYSRNFSRAVERKEK